VYNVKLNSDGSLAPLKARLVAKEYSQIYDIDYQENLSSVARLTFVLFISFTATYHWPWHQLDINNAIFHCIFDGDVYMEQQPDFVARGECGQVYRLRKSLHGL